MEIADVYNNPYNTNSECIRYRLYYYAYTKKSLKHFDCIRYADCEKYRESVKSYGKKRKPYKKKDEPLTQEDYDNFNSLSQNKYLIPKESTKYGKHCRLFSGTHKHEIYKLN